VDTPSWAESRARAASYCRRRPEESALYRIVYHYRDKFERRWPELFEHQYGALRREVLDALDRYLNCGILFCGAARAYCANCKHSQLIAFSCKRRGLCPSCDAKRGVIFAEHINDNVLFPLPHRHLTFSIPKRLRVFFKYDRKLIKLVSVPAR
jgi:Transposase zinc-binding domain